MLVSSLGCSFETADIEFEYTLSQAIDKGSKGKSYAEYQAEKTGTSWKGKLKIAIDTLIPQAADFEDFLRLLQAAGYELNTGKYISCRALGQERFTRLKTLGADYTEEAITQRINGKLTRAAKSPRAERNGVSLLIDIENSIKAQQSRGYEQWEKIQNLKQAADALKGVEKRLADMALLIKNISTYQKTKPVYDAYRAAKNKAHYRAGQESNIILYEAAARAIKAASNSGKLPSVAALQTEYAKLQEQKETLYADYGKLKKQVKEYGVIKQNIDSILRQNREPERGKEIGR